MAKLMGFPIVESDSSDTDFPKEITFVNPFAHYVSGTLNGLPFKTVRSEYEQVRRDHPELNLPEAPSRVS